MFIFVNQYAAFYNRDKNKPILPEKLSSQKYLNEIKFFDKNENYTHQHKFGILFIQFIWLGLY